MSEIERNKTITLVKPVSDNSGKQTWESIELHEPALVEVIQFQSEGKKGDPLNAMALLITLLSGVPREVVNKLAFTDYKACEEYLLGFLTYSQTAEAGGN